MVDTPSISPADFEPMPMPAIDFKTYAREGNPHLGDGSVYPDHVIIFTGAAGKKREEVLALSSEIAASAGMPDPARANTQLFNFRSIAPHVAGIIVPRAQLDTCMRWANIEEVPNVVALQGKLVKAIRARETEFGEAQEAIAHMQATKEEAAARAQQTTKEGHDFLSRMLKRLDTSPQEEPAPTR